MKNMLKIFPVILAVFLLSSMNILAQDMEKPEKPKRQVSTLIGSLGDDIYISGYGAFTSSYTRIKDKDALLCGIRGGLILDNFVLGLSGGGLAYPYMTEDFGEDALAANKPYINFGYGGAMVEYYFFPKRLVHFSLGTTIGGGGLNFSSTEDSDNDDDRSADKFFFVEPEANVFLNIARFCRIGIGGYYRYLNGLENDIFKDKDFNGPGVRFVAAFGWF